MEIVGTDLKACSSPIRNIVVLATFVQALSCRAGSFAVLLQREIALVVALGAFFARENR